jgi:hypothetical protein
MAAIKTTSLNRPVNLFDIRLLVDMLWEMLISDWGMDRSSDPGYVMKLAG